MSIEKQLGDVFVSLFKTANEAKIVRFIAEREYKQKAKEQQRLQEIEEEKKKKVQETEERNRRKRYLIENIEDQMEGWFKSQKLHAYAKELEEFASGMSEDTTKELLARYIRLVRQKAEKCDPLIEILNEIKEIAILDPTE